MLKERLGRAWYRHPVVSFFRHRRIFTFYQQLHALIRAGVPLPTGFAQLKQYAPDDAMATGLGRVAAAVQSGSTLGDAMRSNSALFDDANVELLAFAEEAGRLEPVAAALLVHLERVQAQRWKAIMGALWPLYLVGAAVFVGPLLEASQQMTSATSSIGGLYMSNLGRSLGTAALVLGSVLGGPFLIAALDVEVQWDRFKRKLPLLGAPMRQLAASRFVLGLGLSMSSGVEVMRALRISAKATVSPSIVADLPLAEARVRAGGTLVEAVGVLDVIDRTSLGTLAVAETTGTLDTTLERMSKELEEASLRAMRFLAIAVTVVIAALMLIKIVAGMLGTLFGPVKKFYDAAGSGSIERD